MEHICKIEVFVTKSDNRCQFRCDVCNKKFEYTDALNHIDRTLGIDEWRRLRRISERFIIEKKRVKKINKNAVFSDKLNSEYIKIS